MFMWLCPPVDVWMCLEESILLLLEFNMAAPYRIYLLLQGVM